MTFNMPRGFAALAEHNISPACSSIHVLFHYFTLLRPPLVEPLNSILNHYLRKKDLYDAPSFCRLGWGHGANENTNPTRPCCQPPIATTCARQVSPGPHRWHLSRNCASTCSIILNYPSYFQRGPTRSGST